MSVDLFEQYYHKISQQLTYLQHELNQIKPLNVEGKLISAIGNVVIASISQVKIGDICLIYDKLAGLELMAEVVAIKNHEVSLLPFGSISNISKQALVKKVSDNFTIALNNSLLGSMVNGLGEKVAMLNSGGEATTSSLASMSSKLDVKYYSVMNSAPNPLNRPIITKQLITGVKVIDLFISCGLGQRLAIFAGAGMGKTTLIGMISRYTAADVVVLALIGERGREVREFIDLELTPEIRKKCILVVVTSDRPPVEQVKAGYVAHTIAEYFRDQGKNVVLFVDSITRFARAQREVGLSAGEPATRGGYPPSVFLSFPRLMERAGNNNVGSITAFYTVLMEGEATHQDPIAEEVKSIVDGHIILSRKLVESGHYPAINILPSLSRIADRLIAPNHLKAMQKVKLLLSKYEELEFLLRVGEYKKGSDKIADEAIEKHPAIMKFLQQGMHETCNFTADVAELIKLAGRG